MRCVFFGWVLLSSFYLRGDTPDSCRYHQIICQALSLCDQQQWPQALQLTTTYLSQDEKGSLEETVVAHQILGDCHLELFDYDLAKRAYDVAKGLIKPGIGQSEQLADVLQKLGNYYLVAKDYASAIPYLDTSLLFRRELYGNEHMKVGDVLNNLGVAYLNLGDFAQAEDYHHQALSIRARGLPASTVKYAQSLNNLALCHQDQGQLNIAVTLLHDARRAYESSGPLHQNQIADVYLNLGNVYSDSSQWGQAIDMYKEAKVRFQDDALAQALCNNNMANAYTRLGGQEIAMRHYSDALRLRKEYLGLRHPDVAETYFNIGMNYFFREQMTKAILYLDSCAIAVGFDLSADPDLLEVSDFRTLLYLLYRKAEVYKVFYEDGQNVEWLEMASEIYGQIDVLFDHLRSTYKAIQTKQELLAIAHHVYDQGIQVLYQLFSTTNEARHLHVAFKYAEKSKGILLLEALQKTKANSFLNIPQSTLDSIRIMEENIANLEKGRFLLVQAEYDKGRKVLDSLSAAILWSKRALSRRISEIATQFPDYHALRYETVPPSVSFIQQMLIRNDESLISYFLGDGYVMIFLVNKDGFEVRKVRIDPSFFDVCNAYLNSIQDFQNVGSDRVEDNVQTYIHAATSLLEALIDPIQSHLSPALIIVPDGQLGFLPFEAFLTGPVTEADHFRDYPYLVKSYAVSYNYSVRALQEMKQKVQSTGLKPYLGLAPKFSSNSIPGLLPLVHNEAEVLAAKSTLGGKVLLSGQATKEVFLNLQSNYRILHLATHALANNQADDFSFIAFENIDEGRESSSLLYVREIYNLSAPADMVILSACETAAGRLYLGDGIASIARGFSFAGAKSLLATRWNINDKTTQSLMAKFLEEIKSGIPKSRALQLATTDFIRESSSYHAHPFFWASFMGVGSMEAIHFPSTSWPWIVALSCLILATILYLRHQRSDHSVDV